MSTTIADSFLFEFEEELKTTRKFLERIPADKLTWKPHEKSMSAGQLSFHIAQSLGNVANMAQLDSFPMPPGGNPQPQPETVEEILTTLEESAKTVRSVLPTIDDAKMQETWSLLMDDRPVFEIPRLGVFRTILLNHMYHHRGQLGVYLRLMGCQVPSSYGPSGDEMPDFMKDLQAAG